MKLQTYKVNLTTVTPVFVGSGKEISKKEFMLQGDSAVIVDPAKLYDFLWKKGKSRQYEEYLLSDSRDDLKHFLLKEGINPREVNSCIKYSVPNRDYLSGGGRLQINEFCKDSYGLPYVPGSSIKGMLRTIIAAHRIMQAPARYRAEAEALLGNLDSRDNRKYYLRNNAEKLEEIAFHTLHRPDVNNRNAVNDEMSGFVVSDSVPLALSDLVLTQRLERHVDGVEKPLNILRESLRPGTVIHFTLTIDPDLCKVTVEELFEAIREFNEQYNENFVQSFGVDGLQPDQVLLGGGVGFLSKTVLFPLVGKDDGVKATARYIFEKSLGPKKAQEHGHPSIDLRHHVAPHIIKYTKYGGRSMPVGVCKLSVESIQ